jgi:ATP-dependent DNA helicase RecG
MPRLALDDPVTAVPGVGTRAAGALQKAFDIQTVRDLIEHYPAQGPGKYRDTGALTLLVDAAVGDQVTIVGTVTRWAIIPTRRKGMTIAKATIADDRGDRVEAPFFNQEWRPRQHPAGTRVAVSGSSSSSARPFSSSPRKIVTVGEEELDHEADRIQATYPATEALPSPKIAALVAGARRAAAVR